MDGLVNPAPAARLPALRQDLRLHEAAPGKDGSPAWSIQDPVTNRFFRIGWLEFEFLLRWPGDAAQIADDVAATTPLAADKEMVEAFAGFLVRHHLVRPSADGVKKFAQDSNQVGWKQWNWWLHHYLFIRVPLVRPDRLLRRLLPWVRPLYSAPGLLMIALASLTGMVLVARQWDAFTHGVLDMLTPTGIVGFLLALVISKTFHELGHAFVSTNYGVRVAHMGVAFLVLWPMLYTDTSESWRLRSAKQRLAISSAGILVEVGLAGLSTLAWALLDDGLLRQAMLYLATTGWLLSLALNASPFMRFDGYFILSDLLDFPNLHERSGAMAKATVRRVLLGWDEPDPEPVTLPQRRAMVAFAVFTWLYRLVVFVGIAVAVYLMFFKVLGIFLFAVEVSWFIVRPFWSEISVWLKRRREVLPSRRVLFGAVLLGLAGLLVLPWSVDVEAPGVAHPERQQFVYGPFPSQVVSLHPGGPVTAGTSLVQLQAPSLLARTTRTEASVQALQRELSGMVADRQSMDRQQASAGRLREQLAEASSIRDEEDRLRITAEFAGLWVDLDPDVRAGSWVGTKNQLGLLVDPTVWVVDAYVEQRHVDRIQVGAQASFRSREHWVSQAATVLSIDSSRSRTLAHPALDAKHGGTIATHMDGNQAVPVEALYRVRLALAQPLADPHERPGQVSIEGDRQSLAWRFLQRLIALVIRESGF